MSGVHEAGQKAGVERLVVVSIIGIAGPQPETMAGAAGLLAAKLGAPAEIIESSAPENPDREQFENGGLLPAAHAELAGPTFAEWLEANYPPV